MNELFSPDVLTLLEAFGQELLYQRIVGFAKHFRRSSQ
jgi:hypothetical protein